MNPGCRIHPGAFAKLIHRGNSSPPPRSIIAFFRGFPPWWRDGPASPSPHIRFHGRDARKYRQGGDRAVRRCRGGAPFLADGAIGIASRPHHGRSERPEERRVGTECVSRGSTRWAPNTKKK